MHIAYCKCNYTVYSTSHTHPPPEVIKSHLVSAAGPSKAYLTRDRVYGRQLYYRHDLLHASTAGEVP